MATDIFIKIKQWQPVKDDKRALEFKFLFFYFITILLEIL